MSRSFPLVVACSLFVVALGASAAAPPPPPLLNGVVRGVVTDVKGPNVTLMGTVTVDVSSATVSRRGKAATATALTPGTRVTIAISTASAKKPGVLLADTITVDAADATLTGPLDETSAKTITVMGQQVTVNDDTFFGGFVDGKAVQSVADLKTTYPLEVEITPGANGPVAVSVTALGPAPRAPQPPPANHGSVTGTVSSIEGHVWTVGGTKVFIIEKKTVITGAPAVGDTVRAEGLQTPEGSLLADMLAKQ